MLKNTSKNTHDFYIVRYSNTCLNMFEFTPGTDIDEVRKTILEHTIFCNEVNEEIIFFRASDLEKQVIYRSTEKYLKGFDLINKFLRKYNKSVYEDIKEYASICNNYKYVVLNTKDPEKFLIKDLHTIVSDLSYYSGDHMKFFDLDNSIEVMVITDVKLQSVD